MGHFWSVFGPKYSFEVPYQKSEKYVWAYLADGYLCQIRDESVQGFLSCRANGAQRTPDGGRRAQHDAISPTALWAKGLKIQTKCAKVTEL